MIKEKKKKWKKRAQGETKDKKKQIYIIEFVKYTKKEKIRKGEEEKVGKDIIIKEIDKETRT